MPAMTKMESPKTAGFVDRGYNYQTRQKRIEEEEKEIARLEAKARGQEVPEDEELEEDQQASQEVGQTEAKEDQEPLDPEEKSFKKRYGDLRRHMAEKEKEWEKKLEELKGGSTKQIIPPKSDEDIAEWAKKYPDVAGIVETIAQKKAEAMVSEFRDRFERLDEIEKQTKRKTAEQQIREAHEDFEDLRGDDSFHNWVADQPKWVQDALYENEDDAGSVIRVLDLYKMDKGMTPSDKRKRKKQAASLVKPSSKTSIDPEEGVKKFYESKVAKMSAKEYEAAEDEIMDAMRKGNFVYDLSGGAR